MGYNFAREVDKIAMAVPERLAVLCLNEHGYECRVTYGELRTRSNQLANALYRIGIKRGDRVLILIPRGIDSYIVYLALLKIGATLVPGSEMLRTDDIKYRIQHAHIKMVIAHHSLHKGVDEIRSCCPSLKHFLTVGHEEEGWSPLASLTEQESLEDFCVEIDDEDVAFISYTSGTTGGPKGVMHVYSWPREHLAGGGTYWFDVQPGELAWATAGPGWMKWIWSPFVSILGNAGTAFVYTGRFHPGRYLQLIEKYGISLLCATPTEYRLMAKVSDLGRYHLHLRSAVSAGEPLNREVIDTFQREFNVEVRDGYGQTEGTLLVGMLRDVPVRPGSMGQVLLEGTVSIIDDNGIELPTNHVGHIAVHRNHPALFQGYFADQERTEKAFRGEWYITGDKGKRDEDGYFWFEGRSDDIIISCGYTIGPFEVEDALVKHPKVAECAVVASPDVERGHIIKAFVILRNPDDVHGSRLISELQEHVKRVTAPYKCPRSIVFVESLPKTISGKIRRVELREKDNV